MPPILRAAVSISASSFFSFSIASTAGLTAALSPPSAFAASFTAFTASPAAETSARFEAIASGVGAGASSFAASAAPSSVVTWNISPAPSQSLCVMSGVCTYRKPFWWKNVCVA